MVMKPLSVNADAFQLPNEPRQEREQCRTKLDVNTAISQVKKIKRITISQIVFQ